MVTKSVLCWLIVVVMATGALANPSPVRRDEDSYSGPLSDLTSRVHLPRLQGMEHPSLLQGQERLPLPTPQELEAIKKVAQILVMLGEQVIPAIINEPSSNHCEVVDTPSDPVITEN